MKSVLALFALLSALLVAPPDDDIVREFKKYFRKYKETSVRVEAVRALEGNETKGVVGALVPVLKDDDAEVVGAAIQVLSGFKEPAPVAALLEILEKDKSSEVRTGILRAITLGNYKGTARALLACLPDREWQVRRRAVLALAQADEPVALEDEDPEEVPRIGPLLLPLTSDPEVAVRAAALESLAARDSELVIDPALASLEDDSWQVRSAAIAALGKVRRTRSVGPLLERMAIEEGRLVEDLARALDDLTGKGFGQRLDLWQRFWDSYAETYEIPSDAELAALRERQAERQAEYTPPTGTSYHGIDTPSRSILFVIDISGSMENEVIEKERFEEGDYPSYARMDIVKTELARTVEGLESYVKFNILSFATELKSWKKTLVTANVLNKSSAADWANRLEPLGGHSKEGLAAAGLTGSADLSSGKTNTYGALAWALGIPEEGARRDDYEVDVDTIFFLSDGRPTHGRYVDANDILNAVEEANSLRRVVIHCIAIGDFQKSFMERLAEQNGGVFVDLGK